jgi:uncharacterized membrane protein
MDLDSWLHFVHVLAATVWLGGGTTLSALGMRARSASDPRPIAEFARVLPYVGIRILMPSVVIVLVTGVWMVLAGSEFSLSQFWVLLGLGLFTIAFLIGAVYMSRIGIQLDRAAQQATMDGARLRVLLDRWIAGYAVVLVVLIVAVWDMVFKPGL